MYNEPTESFGALIAPFPEAIQEVATEDSGGAAVVIRAPSRESVKFRRASCVACQRWNAKPGISIAALTLIALCEIPWVSPESSASALTYLDTCPITHANGSSPPGERHSPQHHGDGKLWTVLWFDGLIEFGSDRPGSIGESGVLGMKFPWWRGENVRGSLEITGRRLDGDAPPAFGDIPDGYGDTGFQASAIFFPTEGCWEITGSVGDAELTFVHYVSVIR